MHCFNLIRPKFVMLAMLLLCTSSKLDIERQKLLACVRGSLIPDTHGHGIE